MWCPALWQVEQPQPAGDILKTLLQYTEEEGSSPGPHSETMAWAAENREQQQGSLLEA